jgi:hypothetical protein
MYMALPICGSLKNTLWESLEGNCALVVSSEGNASGQALHLAEQLSQEQRKDTRTREYQ